MNPSRALRVQLLVCAGVSPWPSRPESQPSPRPPHRFYVHARDEARSHAHFVAGAESLQDAAPRFAEHWSGAAPDGEVRLIAFDGDTGEERCFCIDLDAGEAGPCR